MYECIHVCMYEFLTYICMYVCMYACIKLLLFFIIPTLLALNAPLRCCNPTCLVIKFFSSSMFSIKI